MSLTAPDPPANNTMLVVGLPNIVLADHGPPGITLARVIISSEFSGANHRVVDRLSHLLIHGLAIGVVSYVDANFLQSIG